MQTNQGKDFELERLKEELSNAKMQLDNFRKECRERRFELKSSIYDQEKLCYNNYTCRQNLQEHLEKCQSTYKKCSKHFIANECRLIDNNGRCCHYYKIEVLKDELDDKDGFISINDDCSDTKGGISKSEFVLFSSFKY